MASTYTGRKIRNRPHPHPFTRQRCEGTLLEFDSDQLPELWVHCDTCPGIGEYLFKPTRRHAAARSGVRATADGIVHGTRIAYKDDHCRCDPCTDAYVLSEKRRKLKRQLAEIDEYDDL